MPEASLDFIDRCPDRPPAPLRLPSRLVPQGVCSNFDKLPKYQTLCRAVVKSKGKLVSPEAFFAAMGLPTELVESRRGTMEGNKTVAAFAALDAAQKASAAAA